MTLIARHSNVDQLPPVWAWTNAIPQRAQPQSRRHTPWPWESVLMLLSNTLTRQHRVLQAGDAVYRAGEHLSNLYVLNSGFVKVMSLASDGREQLVSLKWRGDWLGFDGMATSHHSCEALALDTSEVWAFKYEALLAASAQTPELLTVLHEAMGRELTHDRDALMSVCTLPAEARVAEFLCHWVESLAARGLRTDAITLRMTRAEIGNYLGMTLESVSRALSKLARQQVISFVEKRRRDVCILDLKALTAFIQRQ
jgi:CRP/FNR family transcriptional regulator, anaerobic regulatory protein